jgi:LPXTG-motif cell wall-anchored protein
MSQFRRRVSIFAVALALVPTAAYGQGAGDDQYEDPFGDESQQEEPTPAPTPAPTTAPPPVQPGATATAAPPSETPEPANTLPYTGIDGWPVAIAGALLLGAGLTLRVRLRADGRP